MYLVFTRMPGESYRRRLRSLLRVCVTSVSMYIFLHLTTTYTTTIFQAVSSLFVVVVCFFVYGGLLFF